MGPNERPQNVGSKPDAATADKNLNPSSAANISGKSLPGSTLPVTSDGVARQGSLTVIWALENVRSRSQMTNQMVDIQRIAREFGNGALPLPRCASPGPVFPW